MSKPFYVYAADVYCESCGEMLKRSCDEAGQAPADPHNEATYDSGDYPKGPFENEESDTPQHCGGHERCLEAVVWPDGSKSGAFLENPLTRFGCEYVLEQFKEERNPITRLWMDFYGSDEPIRSDPWYKGYKDYYDGDEPDHAYMSSDESKAWADGWEAARKDDHETATHDHS